LGDDGMSDGGGRRTTRREFLRQSLAFSAVFAIDPRGSMAAAREPMPPPNPEHRHMLLLGDWGTNRFFPQQIAVAQAMQTWAKRSAIRPDALFMLGDNWYGTLPNGEKSERWQKQFEQMYPEAQFPGPAYAVLGNHDYERFGANKRTAELAYGKATRSRWTMPSQWYTFRFPEEKPIVTFLCLDSNLPGTKGVDLNPWSFLMSKQERDEQDAWLRKELAKPRTTKYLAVIAHHPLYTNGIHNDNRLLIKEWDGLLRNHKVDFYITGHDHDLQHLQFEGHPTSFVISGGGGAELVEWSRDPKSRGPWGEKSLGFTDMELAEDSIVLRHIGPNAETLYAFRKDASGKVTPLG
jgi:tartrate-resistant acid phosphatase type 5